MFAAMMAGVCAGAILLPVETSAAPRGAAGGPALHAPVPHVAQMPAVRGHTPWARPGLGPHSGRFARDHFRRMPGYAWPFVGGGWLGPVVTEYDSGTGAYPDRQYPAYAPPPPPAASLPPAPPVVQSVTRVIVVRGTGCESTDESVPWRDGSPRTIRVVRC
jgi:hypothetical protein